MTTLTFIVGGYLIGVLLLKIRLPFAQALVYCFQFYGLAWFIYGCIWCAVYVLKIALVLMLGLHYDWPIFISGHKWIIQGIIYLIPVVMMLRPSSSNSSTHKSTTGYSSKSKTRIKPTIIPIPTSTPKKQVQNPLVRPISRKNLTNLKNNLRDGRSLTISLKDYCDTDISELTSYAGQYGTKISLIDCNLVSSTRQLANIARHGRGFVYVDSVIEAGTDALELADNSVCFTCDCKNRSTSIKYIVEKARKTNAKIVLINCRSMTTNEIAELRSIGKDNIEIR